MMSHLRSIIPGARHWPRFERNASEQFEGRLVRLTCRQSPSLFFEGMAGSRMPIANAHGEGRASFADAEDRRAALVAMRYVDSQGRPTERYPYNPNGSTGGIAGLTRPRTAASPSSCRTRSACSGRFRCRGSRRGSARTRRGCGCSATHGGAWAKPPGAGGRAGAVLTSSASATVSVPPDDRAS